MTSTPGRSQSPINLCQHEITFVEHLPEIDLSYPHCTDVTLVNTGSPDEFATVRADVRAGVAHLTLDGVRHDLAQFHWHTPSEHQVEGRGTALEMHFVHRTADDSFLVLAVFIKQGGANSAIDPIFRELPGHPGGTCVVPDVNLRGLFPTRHGSFRYSGSLTTPPFTEPVRFIVFADPITFSKRQIDMFRGLFEKGDSREVQPLNGRQILCDAGGILTEL